MSQPIYEVVVFDVTSSENAVVARRQAMQAVKTYPGFRRYRAMRAAADARVFADLIEWDDLASAQAAAREAKSDPRFAGMKSSILGVRAIGHFLLDEETTP